MKLNVQGNSKQYSIQRDYVLLDCSPIIPMIQNSLGLRSEKDINPSFHRIAVSNEQGQMVEVSLDRLVQASKKFGFSQMLGSQAKRLMCSVKERWTKKPVHLWHETTQVELPKGTRQISNKLFEKFDKLNTNKAFGLGCGKF